MKIFICKLSFFILGFCISANAQQLDEKTAADLARLPLHCIINEYPNKVNHSAEAEADAKLLPHELHPSFYGCLDWHSSVHGHWLLVRVLKQFPSISNRDTIVATLDNSFQPEKILVEAEYFTKYKNSNTFERTYGWAWLLKLDEELLTWNDPKAKQWHEALQPLTKKIVTIWKGFLPKQTYPNRTGVHPNTAFGLVFALDWARVSGDTAFERTIVAKAKEHYLDNTNAPAYLEPDGTDFLSPSLEIADLMRRVLPKQQFITWLNNFYSAKSIQRITTMPLVSDRTDMMIVHLDGLSLSRAWCMKGISKILPAAHPWKKLFSEKANEFLKNALPHVTSGNYGGDHWLASFALYALADN
ncbi:MAG TPA: DUF2891 domain-containing protein [Puia sp.]|nr:DUF2891 domain-containing protein [Puia sp.]